MTIELIGTLFLIAAVTHTFSVGFFQKKAKNYPQRSAQYRVLHVLGEVEAVFGIWAILFLAVHACYGGVGPYLARQNFTEPLFVFVIMTMASARPVILFAEKFIQSAASFLPLPKRMGFYVAALVVGPLLGSLITEPAAMTVTAYLLLDYFYSGSMSERFKYATIGLLFVNISIGGTLTNFAAPPVLMVAESWNWDTPFMLAHFGWKAALAIFISTSITAYLFKSELKGKLEIRAKHPHRRLPTIAVTLVHLIFLAAVVFEAHNPIIFFSLLFAFIGFVFLTKKYQENLQFREPAMVAFFLAGLVVLGTIQQWWLKGLLLSLNDMSMYFGATALTSVTDNAALTYLGSLVDLSDTAKYSLVAGAVTGGGLTVIANAPNPAGYGILNDRFKNSSVNPFYLFLGALGPTVLACLCFQLLG
jgi:hypothetical protein